MTQQELKKRLREKWYYRAKYQFGSKASTHAGLMRALKAKRNVVPTSHEQDGIDLAHRRATDPNPMRRPVFSNVSVSTPRLVQVVAARLLGMEISQARSNWKLGRSGEKACARFGHWPLDVSTAYAQELDSLLCTKVANNLVNNWPYRQAQSTWAGGEHGIMLSIVSSGEEILCGGVLDRVWSANGKWSGSNSNARLRVSLRAIQLFPTLLADGAIVLDVDHVGAGEYRMTWVEQSRGVNLKAVDGWYIGGRRITAPSLEAARKKAASPDRRFWKCG